MTPDAPSSAKRNYALDAVKIAATFIILFLHFQQVSGAVFSTHPNFWGDERFLYGWMVELFFMISGFFAYQSQLAPESRFGSYIAKRAKRLLPTMACSTIVYFVLLYLHWKVMGSSWLIGFFGNSRPNVWGLLISCLGLQCGWGFENYYLNNPMWFVSVLLFCYCYAYFLFFLKRKLHGATDWHLVVLMFFFQALRTLNSTYALFPDKTLRGLLCFTIGMLLRSFITRYTLRRLGYMLCAAAMAIYVGFTFYAPLYIHAAPAFIYVFCPALILLCQSPAAQRIFRHSAWGTVSAISYHTYVWHASLQLLLCTFWPQIGYSHQLGHMYLFALMAWLLGTASHFLLEPVLHRLLPAVGRLLVKPKET